MPYVEWGQKYLLGVEQFDLHHKHLVELLNSVHEMFIANQVECEKLKTVLTELVDYADYHFGLEESWMRQIEYPQYEEHVLQHKQFIFKLHDFNMLYRNDKAQLTIEIITFLKRWLLEHIRNADGAYGAFIHRKTGCSAVFAGEGID